MDIEDIKFYKDKVFLLKGHTFKSAEFEDTIKKFNYANLYSKYRNIKDESGVENEKFPPVNFVFFKYIFDTNKVPSPEEIVEFYFNMYKDEVIVKEEVIFYKGSNYNKDALIARILRTYPSLIRDFHFYLLLTEQTAFEKITYSCKDDIEGKDIIIKHNKHEYVISLFANTQRSRSFKKVKNNLRHEYNGFEIQVPINLKTGYHCGDFTLYSPKDIEYIYEEIKKRETNLR